MSDVDTKRVINRINAIYVPYDTDLRWPSSNYRNFDEFLVPPLAAEKCKA